MSLFTLFLIILLILYIIFDIYRYKKKIIEKNKFITDFINYGRITLLFIYSLISVNLLYDYNKLLLCIIAVLIAIVIGPLLKYIAIKF